eukprot:scaffold63959_cov27-Tisochrysis_lutea.AAC.3
MGDQVGLRAWAAIALGAGVEWSVRNMATSWFRSPSSRPEQAACTSPERSGEPSIIRQTITSGCVYITSGPMEAAAAARAAACSLSRETRNAGRSLPRRTK